MGNETMTGKDRLYIEGQAKARLKSLKAVLEGRFPDFSEEALSIIHREIVTEFPSYPDSELAGISSLVECISGGDFLEKSRFRWENSWTDISTQKRFTQSMQWFVERMKVGAERRASRLPHVGIIIPTIIDNSEKFAIRRRFLINTLTSLSKLRYDNTAVYVFVNSSERDRDFCRVLEKAYPGFVFEMAEDNYGAAEARNTGMRFFRNPGVDYFLFLDDDIEITDPYLLQKLVMAAEESIDASFVTPVITHWRGATLWWGYQPDPRWPYNPQQRKVFNLNEIKADPMEIYVTDGACMLIRSGLIGDGMPLGNFPTEYNYYHEELLLFSKSRNFCNLKCVVVPFARIAHIRHGEGFFAPHSFKRFARNFFYYLADMKVLRKNKKAFFGVLFSWAGICWQIMRMQFSFKMFVAFCKGISMGIFSFTGFRARDGKPYKRVLP